MSEKNSSLKRCWDLRHDILRDKCMITELRQPFTTHIQTDSTALVRLGAGVGMSRMPALYIHTVCIYTNTIQYRHTIVYIIL